MRSIHIADMIHTWLGYWVEEIRQTISWPDWHIPADHLVGVASRASWSHPGDMLRYCRNVRPTWVKFDSKDTKESEFGFEVLSTKFTKRT